MTARTLRIVALAYLVKTLLIGVAWMAIPDLPQRATAKARAVWTVLFPAGTP